MTTLDTRGRFAPVDAVYKRLPADLGTALELFDVDIFPTSDLEANSTATLAAIASSTDVGVEVQAASTATLSDISSATAFVEVQAASAATLSDLVGVATAIVETPAVEVEASSSITLSLAGSASVGVATTVPDTTRMVRIVGTSRSAKLPAVVRIVAVAGTVRSAVVTEAP